MIAGALLGLAEYFRRTGGRRHWRWLALAPLAFAILPMTMPDALLALFTQGLGGGAVAVALTAIAGGFAVSGRGALWARILCGILALAVIVALVFTTSAVGGVRLALDQPRGAWARDARRGLRRRAVPRELDPVPPRRSARRPAR